MKTAVSIPVLRAERDDFSAAIFRCLGLSEDHPGVPVRLIAADGTVIAHVTVRSPRGFRVVEDRIEAL
jgi:hypothetical protein